MLGNRQFSRHSKIQRLLALLITFAGVAGVFVTPSSSQAPPPHLQLAEPQTSAPIAPLLTDPQLRAEHWFSRRGLQFGVPTGAYDRAAARRHVMEAAQAGRRHEQQPTWNFIGPQPMLNALSNFGGVILPIGNGDLGKFSATGRISAIATDPTTPGRLFVGGANGGVWMSTDGGSTFTPDWRCAADPGDWRARARSGQYQPAHHLRCYRRSPQ